MIKVGPISCDAATDKEETGVQMNACNVKKWGNEYKRWNMTTSVEVNMQNLGSGKD